MNIIIEEDYKNIYGIYSDSFEELRNSSILITGATGMITVYLAKFLLSIADKYNFKLFLQCRNRQKAEKIYEEYLDQINILTFDITEKIDLCEKFTYIIHGASPASTRFFMETPVDVIKPNVLGTLNLLEYARTHNVKRYLLLSSNSIYGEGGICKELLDESDYGIVDPLSVRSSYVESKKMAEQMCIAYKRQYNVSTSIIRICHTYGPTFDIEADTRIIPRIIKQIVNQEDIMSYKDGESKVQYTYIADIISAILITLIYGNDGEAYNAGGDELISMDDAIRYMIKADKNGIVHLYEKEVDENYSFGKGNGINLIKLNNKKLKDLGWKILYSNAMGFERTVNSYLV